MKLEVDETEDSDKTDSQQQISIMIVADLIKGDPDAWQKVHEHFTPRLLGYFKNKQVYDELDREQLYQETMIKVFGNLHKFDPAIRKFLDPWVYGIAHNMMRQAQREWSKRYAQEASTSDFSEIVQVECNDDNIDAYKSEDDNSNTIIYENLQYALSCLSENDQQILHLRLSRDSDVVPWKVIADELGIKESTAKMRYTRALSKLSSALEAK